MAIKHFARTRLVVTAPELDQAKNFFAQVWRRNSKLITKNNQGVWRNVWGQVLSVDYPGVKAMDYQMTYIEIEFEDEPSLIAFVMQFKSELDSSCQ